MKLIYLLFLSFLSVTVFSQQEFEAFAVDDKYGVVEISNFSEFIEPQFDSWSQYFSTITLINGNEYNFIDKTNGKKEIYQSTDIELRFNGMYFMLFEKDGKSVFIPKDVSKKMVFNKRYSKAFGNGSDLIVGTSDYFEVFVKPNFKTAKLNNIAATKLYRGFIDRKRTKKQEYVTIFYGQQQILVYDAKFNLLKKYDSEENYESRMFDIISNEFTKITNMEQNGYSTMPKYFEQEFLGDYTTITHIETKKSFKLKGNYVVRAVNYGESNWIRLIDSKDKKDFTFRIDFSKRVFYIPYKYQKELKLEFL